jgi:hypothetical protein
MGLDKNYINLKVPVVCVVGFIVSNNYILTGATISYDTESAEKSSCEI